MPEENFEQQVRHKTEAFGMEPNPDVWLHVKTAIAPAERRRRVLLWWWMLPLCVAGIVAVWPNHNRKSSRAEKASIANGGGHLLKKKEMISSLQQAENESGEKKPLINKKEERVTENLAFQKQIDAMTSGKENKRTGKDLLGAIPFEEATDKENENGNVIANTRSQNATGKHEEIKTLTDDRLYASLRREADTQQTSIDNDNIIVKNEIKPDSISVTANDSLFKKSMFGTGNKKKKEPQRKSSWQTGITAEIGLTSWGKDLLYNEVGSPSAYSTDGSIWSVTVRDSIVNNTTAIQQTKNGLTAAAGFVIRKEMQHHFYISGLLGYRYQQFKVYNLRTSSIPQPFGGGSYFVNKDNYHTHFLNLTISAGKRLLSNKRNAVSAEAGMDNSFLFMLNQQNAKQSSAFNMAKSLGASSFNRWQPYFVASLPFDWHTIEKMRFVVSPFARFGLRSFQKNGNDYKNNHLISAGMQAVYFFK